MLVNFWKHSCKVTRLLILLPTRVHLPLQHPRKVDLRIKIIHPSYQGNNMSNIWKQIFSNKKIRYYPRMIHPQLTEAHVMFARKNYLRKIVGYSIHYVHVTLIDIFVWQELKTGRCWIHRFCSFYVQKLSVVDDLKCLTYFVWFRSILRFWFIRGCKWSRSVLLMRHHYL